VTQGGLIDEKTEGQKSRDTFPLSSSPGRSWRASGKLCPGGAGRGGAGRGGVVWIRLNSSLCLLYNIFVRRAVGMHPNISSGTGLQLG
jgi:hypothetical protein